MNRACADERCALILAPHGRDASLAQAILGEAGLAAEICPDLDGLCRELARGAELAVVAEEALATADLHGLSAWLGAQPPWSDFPFVLLTQRGGGLERNPAARRYLDVLGNVTFGLQAGGMSSADAAQRAGSALELVGLQGLERRATSALSGGQQQRVALARALALQPSVLLLDEPLSNLDVQLRRQVRDEIRSLQRRLGITMAYVTHDESEALALADFIVVMNDGRLLQTGTPREVYERPANEMVAAFLGDAEVFDAAIGDDGSLMLGPLRLALTARADTPVRVMVRPEAWRVQPAGREGLAGRMSRCAYLGSHVEYHVDTELGLVLVKSAHAQALHQPGAPVSLTLATRGVMVWTAQARSPDTPAVSVPCHPEQPAPEAVLLQGEK